MVSGKKLTIVTDSKFGGVKFFVDCIDLVHWTLFDFSIRWHGNSGIWYSNIEFCFWWILNFKNVGSQSISNSMRSKLWVSNICFYILLWWGCKNIYFRPRDGCLQYHTGLTGRFTSFNFIPTGDNHLKEQKYGTSSTIMYLKVGFDFQSFQLQCLY